MDWPLEAPGLKTALGGFYRRADDVARDLLVAFARACCLPEEHDDDGGGGGGGGDVDGRGLPLAHNRSLTL